MHGSVHSPQCPHDDHPIEKFNNQQVKIQVSTKSRVHNEEYIQSSIKDSLGVENNVEYIYPVLLTTHSNTQTKISNPVKNIYLPVGRVNKLWDF